MRLSPVALAAALVITTATGSLGASSRRGEPTASASSQPVRADVSVCFVPAQQCDVLIVAAIERARETIRVQAYGFTAPAILSALLDAKARGVDVQVILDKSNDPLDRSNSRDGDPARSRIGGATYTAVAGIPTWIDHAVAIAHNKVIIIDSRTVIGGSYNFTTSAERRNAENVTFINSADIARLYLTNWDARKSVARQYLPPVGLAPYVPPRSFAATGPGRR